MTIFDRQNIINVRKRVMDESCTVIEEKKKKNPSIHSFKFNIAVSESSAEMAHVFLSESRDEITKIAAI